MTKIQENEAKPPSSLLKKKLKQKKYFLIILIFICCHWVFAAGETIKLGRTRHSMGQGILGVIHSQSLPQRYF